MDKIKFGDFVRQIAAQSGYTQTDIKQVLKTGSAVIASNLKDGKATTIMQGVIIYPSIYPATQIKQEDGGVLQIDEKLYPRARFGKAFKKQLLYS